MDLKKLARCNKNYIPAHVTCMIATRPGDSTTNRRPEEGNGALAPQRWLLQMDWQTVIATVRRMVCVHQSATNDNTCRRWNEGQIIQ